MLLAGFPILILAILEAAFATICPLINHTVCNSKHSNHACVCAITTEEAPPPEKSCNLLLGIKSDEFPGISVEFELNSHVEHLKKFPEQKFRNFISRKLRIDPDRMLILRNRCLDDNKKFVLQFAVLKKTVKIEPDKSISKKETISSGNERDNISDDDDDYDDADDDKDNSRSKTPNKTVSDNDDYDNSKKSSLQSAQRNSAEEQSSTHNEDDDDEDVDENDRKSNKDENSKDDYSKTEESRSNDDKSKIDSDDKTVDDEDDDDNDNSDEHLFDEKGHRKPYKLKDFEEAVKVAKNLRVDDTLDFFEDMRVEIKDVKELYNIEAIQENSVLIFQAIFAGVMIALICILGIWRAIVTREKIHYESVEGKV